MRQTNYYQLFPFRRIVMLMILGTVGIVSLSFEPSWHGADTHVSAAQSVQSVTTLSASSNSFNAAQATSVVYLPLIQRQEQAARPTATNTPTHVIVPGTIPPASGYQPTPVSSPVSLQWPIVFVSRQIPTGGSVYYKNAGTLPGVGPYSRFQVASPGKLIVREPSGTMRILIDGSKPSSNKYSLIDVNAPDVSYDGTQILFSGITQGQYSDASMGNPGAWRIYVINIDGSNLRQVTFSDRGDLDLSQFKKLAPIFKEYDDTDPTWLPDGRIVFSSTRWPSFGMYGASRTDNLYVMNADGSAMHRITSERNSADRAMVDPLTGKIVYSRWWRNFRVATNSMDTIANPLGGYIMNLGLLAINQSDKLGQEVGGNYNLERNAWHLATINPDGTELRQWAGRSNTTYGGQDANMAYGGTFTDDGTLYANFFPMMNLTEAAGFGGIRRYKRGANSYEPMLGITTRSLYIYQLLQEEPPTHAVFKGAYAAEPAPLPDGRLIASWAAGVQQDYGLYVLDATTGVLTLLYDNPNTSELRARLIRSRPLPPIITDKVTEVASALPPLAEGPYDQDGTFTFNALNVYFNAPIDVDIATAMPVGSAASIRFFVDHQRDQQSGSHESFDWPILLKELPVNPDGSIVTTSPANVPLFEQIRTSKPGYEVPLVGSNIPSSEKTGAAHVAGLNFGRPGEVQRCVGCHAGHTMIAVPESREEATWTNLAPGAALSFSSILPNLNRDGLTDRKVRNPSNGGTEASKYWVSDLGVDPNRQWVQLTFPVPVSVRTVRIYNVLPLRELEIQVHATTVKLYSDATATVEVARNNSGELSSSGTDVSFSDVKARVVRIELTDVTGTRLNQAVAGLAEVEVIARGESIQ